MNSYLFVALGGACGALCRYLVGRFFVVVGLSELLFFSTTLVNLLGCFVMGYLAAGTLDPKGLGYLGLCVGFLGAFTTFSSFALEWLRLLHDGRLLLSLVHLVCNVGGSLGFCAAGFFGRKYFLGS